MPLALYRGEALCRGCCDAIGPRVYEQATRGAQASRASGRRLG